ncbi:hypothetical protein NW762_012842 [Fusarium torreyae]|uniref:JmjC domain-containing protein n=1 Tax=Fusarium torreyae TaxID=1237075 RepID=A0A9W8RPM5_9HYPO|nr:hypothetical protein NW762_012842 [Fusarium torreyae]
MTAQNPLDPTLDSILAAINEWVADCSQISTNFEAQSSSYANKLHALNKGARTIRSLVQTLIDNSANDTDNELDLRINLPARKDSTKVAAPSEHREIEQEHRSEEGISTLDTPTEVAIVLKGAIAINASGDAIPVPPSPRGKSGGANTRAASPATPLAMEMGKDGRMDTIMRVNNITEANAAPVDPPGSTENEDVPMNDAEPPMAQPLAVVTTVHAADRRPNTPNWRRLEASVVMARPGNSLSPNSDTTETTSPSGITDSTASPTDSIATRFTTPVEGCGQDITMLDSQSPDEKVARSKGDEQASPSTRRSLTATAWCQRDVTNPLPAPRPENDEAEFPGSFQSRRSLTSEGHHAGDGPETTQDVSQAQEATERSAYQSTTDTSSDTEKRQAILRSKTGLQQTKETDAPSSNKPRISLPTGKRSALVGTSYERFIVDSEDLPTLEQYQLDERMPETLHKISQTSGYTNKAKLPWLTDISPSRIKEVLTPEGDPDVQFNELRLRADGGVNVYRDDPEDGRKFEWPDFKKRVRPMTAMEASQELDRFLTKPDPYVSYYCGLMKSELWKLCPLHAGKQLAGIKGLTHVNQIYTHLGKRGSATAIHKEDDRFGSVNVGLAGTKLFFLIEAGDTEKFEIWVRSNYVCKPCPQFVRHLNIFFGPEQLEAAGIRFKILIQRVGDLIETKPHQYHQVLNIEDSLAISINQLAPLEIPQFLDINNPLEVCDGCGLKGLLGRKDFYVRWVDPDVPAPGSHDAIANARGRKRKARKQLSEVTRDCTKHFDNVARASKSSISLSEVCQMIRAGAPGFEIPQGIGPRDMIILNMVAWIVSPQAIQQFTSLIRAWRTRQTYRVVSSNTADPLEEYAAYLREAVGKTEISNFQLRYARVCIAREVDDGNSQRLRIKLNKAEGEAFAKKLGMTSKDLQRHLEEGRAWNRICGRFEGLLPFIYLFANAPYNIRVKDWKALKQESLKLLHHLLEVLGEHVEQRCRAGRIAQEIVLRGSDAVFQWEKYSRPLGTEDVALLGEIVERTRPLT